MVGSGGGENCISEKKASSMIGPLGRPGRGSVKISGILQRVGEVVRAL